VIYSCSKSQRDVFISQIYFWSRTLHVSDVSLSIIRSINTVHTAIYTGLTDCLLASRQKDLYDIYHCCVYSGRLLMMGRETVRNM